MNDMNDAKLDLLKLVIDGFVHWFVLVKMSVMTAHLGFGKSGFFGL